MTESVSLNVIVQRYIKHMLSKASGVKVLILDEATLGVTSVVSSQSEILESEVFLVRKIKSAREKRKKNYIETLEANPDSLKHLNVVYFLQPTAENILILVQELKQPQFVSYYLYFTSRLAEKQLERLAKADQAQKVQEVHYFFCDFLALGPELFSLELPTCHPLMFPDSLQYSVYEAALLEQICNSLTSVLISTCTTPFWGIRYATGSEVCRCIAERLHSRIKEEAAALPDIPIFSEALATSQGYNNSNSNNVGGNANFPSGCMILLCDRRDDPITPLLNQWTYEAMVHELIGIDRNTVTLGNSDTNSGKPESFVLSAHTDPFFATHRMSNFGDLGAAINSYVKDFQQQTHATTMHHQNQHDMSISEMKEFVENYPEFRRLSTNVTKHVQLVHELSKRVESKNLLTLSVTEQDLACAPTNRKIDHFRELIGFIQRTDLPKYELLRLALLFTLRYEGDPLIIRLKEALAPIGVDTSLLDSIVAYTNSKAGNSELFEHNKSIFQIAKSAVQRGFQGVPNVYTQHTSFFSGIFDNTVRGKLKTSHYGQLPFQQDALLNSIKPREIIMFVVGGTTYEEYCDVQKLAHELQRSVYLGGTTIHNSRSFLSEIALMKHHPYPAPPPPPSSPKHVLTIQNDHNNDMLYDNTNSRETDLELKKKFLLEGW